MDRHVPPWSRAVLIWWSHFYEVLNEITKVMHHEYVSWSIIYLSSIEECVTHSAQKGDSSLIR